jgi:hypothetical protein
MTLIITLIIGSIYVYFNISVDPTDLDDSDYEWAHHLILNKKSAVRTFVNFLPSDQKRSLTILYAIYCCLYDFTRGVDTEEKIIRMQYVRTFINKIYQSHTSRFANQYYYPDIQISFRILNNLIMKYHIPKIHTDFLIQGLEKNIYQENPQFSEHLSGWFGMMIAYIFDLDSSDSNLLTKAYQLGMSLKSDLEPKELAVLSYLSFRSQIVMIPMCYLLKMKTKSSWKKIFLIPCSFIWYAKHAQ